METHLPNRGNTEVGQRGSGHLAVSTSVWVAGLIKPAQSPDAGLETRLGANQDRKRRTRTSVLTSANLGRPTADSQGFKPDLGNPAVRDYRGASGNVAMVEMRSHLAIERARLVTLHLQQARRSSIPTEPACRSRTQTTFRCCSVRGVVVSGEGKGPAEKFGSGDF